MKRIALTLLFATPMLAQTVTGRFAPGEQYVEPERNAPPATSRMFVRAADGQGVDLPATGQGGMIVVIGERTSSSARADETSAPLFQRFTVDTDGHEVLHIDKPMAGRYHVNGVHSGAVVIAASRTARSP